MADEVIVPEVPVVPVPAAVVAPVVAPVIPDVAPVVAPVVLPKPESVGNAVFDSMQDVLHDKGIDPKSYVEEVISTGAVSPAKRAELVAALGEPQVRVLESMMTGELQKIETGKAAAAQEIYNSIKLPGVPDGATAFQTIAAWAVANVSQEDRNAYNAMLAVGGVQATTAMAALKEKFMSSPTYANPGDVLTGTTVPAAVGIQPISRVQYTAERQKAHRAHDAVLVQQLDARAQHTMLNNKDVWRPSW